MFAVIATLTYTTPQSLTYRTTISISATHSFRVDEIIENNSDFPVSSQPSVHVEDPIIGFADLAGLTRRTDGYALTTAITA